jgi:two-component system, sensor histidine kinase and response regulator
VPVSVQAVAKGLELVCQVAADVPDALVGDTYRLGQVLLNLVANAIKFTDEGEVFVHVGLESVTEDDVFLHVLVRDTGIGVASENRELIFTPFEQAEGSSRRRHKGAGLGLAISSQLVTLMGGRIWLETELGVGSTFHCVICLERQSGAGQSLWPPEAQTLDGLRVLVIDDNDTSRGVLDCLLPEWGMVPKSVSGGSEAIDAIRKAVAKGETFDLVLLDTRMPQTDGMELAEVIREQPDSGSGPIILLGQPFGPTDTPRLERLGITSRVSKPVRPLELLNAVIMAREGVRQPRSCVEARGKASGGKCVRPLNILLAEDTAMNREVAIHMLNKMGHQVTAAVDGKEAVDLHGQGGFDLILMDVEMPEMDGVEATAIIRARERTTGSRIPIVAMTAHAMTGDREKFLDAGMDGYVAKPVKSKVLRDAIETLAGYRK